MPHNKFFSFQNLLNLKINAFFYLLVFLVPLFFLPFSTSPLFLNKQLLLSALVFLLLILWMLRIISSGKLIFDFGLITKAVLLILLVFGISTIFSAARAQSFWQADQADNFFSILLCILVFLLAANLVAENYLSSIKTAAKTKKSLGNMAFKALLAFLASAGLLSVLFLIQVFSKKAIFPWSFAKSTAFNPIGTVEALAIFLGGAFILLMSIVNVKPAYDSALNQRNYQRSISVKTIFNKLTPLLSIVLGILLFACIVLVNYWAVWLALIIAMIMVLAQMTKAMGPLLTQKEIRKFIVPLIVVAVSLIFIFVRIPTDKIFSYSPEISLNYRSTLAIDIQALKLGAKNLVLGSGPATFALQYDLFKPLTINSGMFWQTRFNQGTAFVPTILSSTGILGLLAVLFLFGVLIWQGIRSFLRKGQIGAVGQGMPGALLSAGLYFLLIWFLYPANLVLLFVSFLLLGLLVGTTQKPTKKEFVFTDLPQKAFLVMLIAVLIMAGSGIAIFKTSQKYMADLSYARGIALINAQEPDLDKGIEALAKAADLNAKDDYFRNLSQVVILKINKLVDDQQLSQEEKIKLFQTYVAGAEQAIMAAVKANPKNSQNWFQQGNVYLNFAAWGLENASEVALASYQKAFELAPTNPEIPLGTAKIYYDLAAPYKTQIADLEAADEKDEAKIQALKQEQAQFIDKAIEQLKKCLELKNNLAPAYYLLAQAYELQGNKDLALQNYLIILQLLPDNEEIKSKIEELSR